MSVPQLKQQIIEAIWRTADRIDNITSATLTGSFVYSDSLEGLSDIDCVVTLKELHETNYQELREQFQSSLEPVLASQGYDLMINSTLGPLKFNAPRLAVLHLMLYTEQSHTSHVIQSPFTCLDWQRSPLYRKKTLSDVYPAFGLQPRHFLSARRSIADYINDFRHSAISYREFDFSNGTCREIKKSKPMTLRDRHEFAYHVMRFLMINLLKLIRQPINNIQSLDDVLQAYGQVFPLEFESFSDTLRSLATKKKFLDFDTPLLGLDERLERFVAIFEQQFRSTFQERASRHILFRHAPTDWNMGELRFQGRSDREIDTLSEATEREMNKLYNTISTNGATRGFTSSLARSKQSMEKAIGNLALSTLSDHRLDEIDYGECEGLTVRESRQKYPHLFEAWNRSDDPCFPNGENSAMVLKRAINFIQDKLTWASAPSAICTHNVVLRNIVGNYLGVPSQQWHRLKIPHLTPITLIATERFGWFVEMEESVQEIVFSDFSPIVIPSEECQTKAPTRTNQQNSQLVS